jgi:hypothetical protein
VFKVLVMGESESVYEYVVRAFQEAGEDKHFYNEFYKEINALEDICDLEVDVLTDIIYADYDEIIPTVDGIIYLMNPLNIDEFEFFEMSLPIINSVKRNIPIVIIFYDKNGILPFITNKFLESVWLNYPELEAFMNLTPEKFHQALECLCLAMIAGDTPLNFENAWLRFPIFIELANKYFKEQNYYYAAQAMKNAATISEIYNNNEFFIYCEQVAFTFSKINLYLEASKIFNRFDKKKSIDFQKLYHKAMLTEGNKLFNKGGYEPAASQYETAAQWASIELEDKKLVKESFKLAINSWISACKVENAFIILERLPHEEIGAVLIEVSDKIVDAAEFLTSKGHIEAARDQLYYSINTYQREGLFDELKKFTTKLVNILITILDEKINENDLYAAKKAYDEIENLWEAYELEKVNVDNKLEILIKLLLKVLNFGMATILINKLNSLELKKKLTEYSIKIEEKNKQLKKREIEEYIQQGVEILQEFIEFEKNIIAQMNSQKIEGSKEYIKKGDFFNAAKIVKNHSVFLKNIGKEEIESQILIKSLDILIEGNLFDNFFKYYSDLTVDTKKRYLIRIYPLFIEKLKELTKEKNYSKKEKIFEMSNKLFRNEMLYHESKEINKLFIKEIKKEALKIIEIEKDLPGIEKSKELIKKINRIASAYLDKDKDKFKITLDKIYKKIAETYISLEDFSSAQAFTDKIENKMFKSEIHKKLAKFEASKMAIRSKVAEESFKAEVLKERLSFIKKKGKDAKHDQKNELRQRSGLKRIYFNDALEFVKTQKFDKAISSYKESIIKLNKIKKYNLAGVSLAIASLLLIKEDRINELEKLIKNIKEKLSSSEKLFSETFPVTLIEYIIDMKKIKDEPKLKKALSYLEYLPLFEEEILILYDYLGKEIEKEEKIEKPSFDAGNIAKFRIEINKIAKNIEKEKQDIAKRKIMKRDYWNKALEELNKNNFREASQIYFAVVQKLVDKKFLKYAAVNLILGTLIQIYEKNVQFAKSTFEDSINKTWKIKAEAESLPEIQIIKYIFMAYENDLQDLIQLILNHLIEKLILFEPEIIFIRTLLGEEIGKEEIEEPLSIKTPEDIKIELDQTISNLQQKIGDIKRDFNDFFTKRKAMKSRYYNDILVLLKNNSFKEAANKYLELAKFLLKRKDYENSSFVLLLHGLSLLKSGESPEQIKSGFTKFLQHIGLSEKILKETFYVSFLLFVIEVKIYEMKEYNPNIKKILDLLPLFNDEKELINIIT